MKQRCYSLNDDAEVDEILLETRQEAREMVMMREEPRLGILFFFFLQKQVGIVFFSFPFNF